MVQMKGTLVPNSDGAFVMLVSAALRHDLGGSAQASKSIMRWTGASERSARNWLLGDKAPNGRHLVMLARYSPSVWQLVLTMADRPTDAIAEDVFIAQAALSRAIAILTEMTSKAGSNKH
jgi:hypothetical protein